MTILADGHADEAGPGSGAPGRGRRTVARRSTTPRARALGGALLIAAAAVVVFSAWLSTTGSSGHPAVVTTQPLAAGTTLSASDLTTVSVRLPPSTANHTFAETGALVGRVLAAPLAPGEFVQSSDLVASGQAPPLRPVAATVDASDAATLAVGDLVDVVVTNGTATTSPTDVVLRGARVLSVNNSPSGLVGADTGAVVTIGVATLDEVTAVVHAERTGTLNIVVGEPGDGTGLSSSSPNSGTSGSGTSSSGTSSSRTSGSGTGGEAGGGASGTAGGGASGTAGGGASASGGPTASASGGTAGSPSL